MVYDSVLSNQNRTMVLISEYANLSMDPIVDEPARKIHAILTELKWGWGDDLKIPSVLEIAEQIKRFIKTVGPTWKAIEGGGIYVTSVWSRDPNKHKHVSMVGVRVYFHAQTGNQGDLIREIISRDTHEERSEP